MKIIIAINLLSQLTTNDLPKKSMIVGITLHYPDLYKGTLLNCGTLECLRHQKASLIEIQFSEEEMLRYHQEFNHCDQYRRLTFEDFVAVAYAKSEGCILLAEKGFLSRYALSKGIEVMSLKELEEYCLQRQRQVRSRKGRLRSYFDDQEHITEKELMRKPIDDDTTMTSVPCPSKAALPRALSKRTQGDKWPAPPFGARRKANLSLAWALGDGASPTFFLLRLLTAENWRKKVLVNHFPTTEGQLVFCLAF